MPLTSGCTKAPEMEMLLCEGAWTPGGLLLIVIITCQQEEGRD